MMRFPLIFCVALLGRLASAQQIETRTELDSILGAEGVTDDFETFSQPNGSITTFTGALDSSTIVEGQGPGLVHPGITYQGFGGMGNDYFVSAGNFGLTSQAFEVETRALYVYFQQPVHAFGVDISGVNSGGEALSVFVFRSDSTFSTFNAAAFAGQPQFVGWQEPTGIEMVQIVNEGSAPNSPIIDNFEFGGAVPEPASLVILTAGLGVVLSNRRRSPR